MNYIKKMKKLLDINSYKALNLFAKGYRKSILKLTLLNIIASLFGVSIAFITKLMIDEAISGQSSQAIKYGIILSILLALQLAVTSFILYFSVRLNETIRNDLQLKIIGSIYRKKWLYINQYKTGDLLTRAYNDLANIIQSITGIIPKLIALLIQLIVAFSVLAYFDPLIATITFLVTPVSILASMIVGRKLKTLQYYIQTADAAQRSKINESLQNIIILKTFRFLQHNLKQIEDLQNTRFDHIKRKNILNIKASLLLSTGNRIGMFGALGLGAIRLSQKAISFGTFTAFIQLVGQVQGPIQAMSVSLPKLITSLSSVDRVLEITRLPNDNPKLLKANYDILPSKIIFDNISFKYTKDVNVINKLSLTINKGEKIAIIGPSGEGKTTLIHILLSLIEPQEGTIIMELENGEERLIGPTTIGYFSYVPQSNTLFSGSIKENLLISNHVSSEDIDKALEASCSYEFIKQLDKGIDTILSERGIGLSQGQAQRITIARALLHNTPYLVFDEATSALDMETETQLVKNLKDYYPNTTLITVTHRESILDICDKVYKLENGTFK